MSDRVKKIGITLGKKWTERERRTKEKGDAVIR